MATFIPTKRGGPAFGTGWKLGAAVAGIVLAAAVSSGSATAVDLDPLLQLHANHDVVQTTLVLLLAGATGIAIVAALIAAYVAARYAAKPR